MICSSREGATVVPTTSRSPHGLQDDDDEIDPDIRELGDYFNIEERWVVRLNEAMKFRVRDGMMEWWWSGLSLFGLLRIFRRWDDERCTR